MCGCSSSSRRIFLIDGENNIGKAIEGVELLSPHDELLVFCRDNFPKDCRLKIERCTAHVEWVKCLDAGIKNSMDAQIMVELTRRVLSGNYALLSVISQDRGFLPAVHYLQERVGCTACKVALHDCVAAALGAHALASATRLSGAQTTFQACLALRDLVGLDRYSIIMSMLFEGAGSCDEATRMSSKHRYGLTSA